MIIVIQMMEITIIINVVIDVAAILLIRYLVTISLKIMEKKKTIIINQI